MKECFYEKRIIHDISGNVYPIWEIYRLDNNFGRQVNVFHDLKEFEEFKKRNNVKYRQLNSRGSE